MPLKWTTQSAFLLRSAVDSEFVPFHSFSSFLQCCDIGSFDPLKECTLMNSNTRTVSRLMILCAPHLASPNLSTPGIFSSAKDGILWRPNRLNELACASCCLSVSASSCVSPTTRKRSREENFYQEEEIKRNILDRIDTFEHMARLVGNTDFKGDSVDAAQVIKEFAAKSARPTFLEAILVGISIRATFALKRVPRRGSTLQVLSQTRHAAICGSSLQ